MLMICTKRLIMTYALSAKDEVADVTTVTVIRAFSIAACTISRTDSSILTLVNICNIATAPRTHAITNTRAYSKKKNKKDGYRQRDVRQFLQSA